MSSAFIFVSQVVIVHSGSFSGYGGGGCGNCCGHGGNNLVELAALAIGALLLNELLMMRRRRRRKKRKRRLSQETASQSHYVSQLEEVFWEGTLLQFLAGMKKTVKNCIEKIKKC